VSSTSSALVASPSLALSATNPAPSIQSHTDPWFLFALSANTSTTSTTNPAQICTASVARLQEACFLHLIFDHRPILTAAFAGGPDAALDHRFLLLLLLTFQQCLVRATFARFKDAALHLLILAVLINGSKAPNAVITIFLRVAPKFGFELTQIFE